MDKEFDPLEFLLFGLKHYNINVESQEGNIVKLERDYMVEIEGPNLFKLLHDNNVVAPFGGVEALCEFINKDMKLNE